MEIQTALSRTNSFSELLQIAERSEPHLTFLGSEYVSASGYEGTLHIDALASRTLELLKQLNYEFSEVEREPGKRLASRIDSIYYGMDKQLDNCNCITKIFHLIRTILKDPSDFFRFSSFKGTRYEWQGIFLQQNITFECFTQSQFHRRFGFPPEEAVHRGYRALRSMGDNPNRVWLPNGLERAL